MISLIKWFLRKARDPLSNAGGETIVESVVSMLVFSIFTLAVLSTLVTALRITDVATRDANQKQGEVNQLVFENYTGGTEFKLLSNDAARSIDLTLPVQWTQAEGLEAFRPKVVGEP